MSYSRENNEVSASGEDMVNAMRGYKACVMSICPFDHAWIANLYTQYTQESTRRR